MEASIASSRSSPRGSNEKRETGTETGTEGRRNEIERGHGLPEITNQSINPFIHPSSQPLIQPGRCCFSSSTFTRAQPATVNMLLAR